MRPASLFIAGLACAILTVGAAAQQLRRGEPASREHYFLDFRARGGGVLGHTFIVHGRMDGGGRVLQSQHVSLYPDEAYEESPMLAVALVRGFVTSKREDPRKPTLAIYRRKLNAAQYAHLQLTLVRLKATQNRWHMVFYNCNDFAGQVAREMGMVAPLAWSLPTTFVRRLYALNGP